ncbi:MAG: hypothetical protein V4560_08015 [Bacteroidota bacterium]
MRYLFILLFLSTTLQISFAQSHAEKKLLQFAIAKGNILYNEKVRDYDINQVREALNKDTLFDWKYTALHEKYGLPDSLVFVLTKAEKIFINKQLDEMKGFTWKKHLFKNSLAVNFEAMSAYRKAHGGKLSFNPEDYKNGGYAFTKPILIRNNTIGFIYVTGRDEGKVLMYVKDKNQWKIKYMLEFWVS